ncbi:MAG: Lrp/AsnC family transcriptional regulator [Candidatus Helarchaeota archaeon]
MAIDELDHKLIEILKKDHRKHYTEIATELGISRNTVNKKITELIRKNIINNYIIVVDPNWFFQKTIFIEIKTNPHEPWLAEALQNLPECESIDGIIGEYSLILKVRILEKFDQILNQIDGLMARSASKKYQIIDIIHIYKENGHTFQNILKKREKRELDRKDLELLEILRNQGKKPLTHSQISQVLKKKKIKISQPAVSKRIRGLEEENIIEGFTIALDYTKLGVKTKFYIRIKVNPACYNTTALEFLSSQPQITDLYRTGENYGLLAVVRTKDIESFNQFLQHLYTDSRILDTHTTLVLEERKKYL